MFGRHPTLEEIEELLDPGVSPAQAGWVSDHLFGCERCWNLATETVASLEAGSTTLTGRQGGGVKNSALKALGSRYQLEQGRLEERLVALSAVGDLRGLTRKGRRELIARRPAYRSRTVVEELLAEAGRSGAPAEGEE